MFMTAATILLAEGMMKVLRFRSEPSSHTTHRFRMVVSLRHLCACDGQDHNVEVVDTLVVVFVRDCSIHFKGFPIIFSKYIGGVCVTLQCFKHI